jgi:murein DD-endopeptidase
MEIPPYLQDKLSSKKRSRGKVLFNLILIASLSLNAYLLTSSQNDAPGNWKIEVAQAEAKEIAEATENIEGANLEKTLAQDVLARATPTPATVGSMEPVLRPEPVTGNLPPELQVTPVSYVVPQTEDQNDIHTLHLKIRNSLTYSVCRAMTKEQGCQAMSAYMSRLLSWNFNINKSMRNGDSLDVAYEMVPDKTRFRILKLVYNSQLFNKVYEANYFSGEKDEWGSYFDQEGKEIAKRVVDQFAPLKNYQEITSLPGDFRKGPVGHKGTDFKTDIGTPVYASFEAKVLRTNWNVRVNGYCVELDHPREGVKTLYLHLSRVLVKPGQFVKQGDKIAETGNTGRTFAPHLHYEIKSRDQKKIVYNPFNFKHIKSFNKKVPQEERESFQKTVNLYDSILQKS